MQEKHFEKLLPKILTDNQLQKLLCARLKKGMGQMARAQALGMAAKLYVYIPLGCASWGSLAIVSQLAANTVLRSYHI